MIHLAADEDSQRILEEIFGGVPKDAAREALDDKTRRTKSLWSELADEFFNNKDWKPLNEQSDSRVSEINPSIPPVEPFSPEDVRSLFSSMRTKYF